MMFAVKRKWELDPKQPRTFLGRYYQKANCEYVLVRMNLLTNKVLFSNIVPGPCGRACIGFAVDRKTLAQCGLRAGDSVIIVDECIVASKELLRRYGRVWADLVIERAPMTNVTESTEPPELSLSSPDDNIGGGFGKTDETCPFGLDAMDDDDPFGATPPEPTSHPSMGVPKQVPPDVEKIVEIGPLVLAHKIHPCQIQVGQEGETERER